MNDKISDKNKNEASIDNIYKLDGTVPVLKAVPFGLQHILAMFVANIAPILIVGGASGLSDKNIASLIQSAMLIAGIGTLIQLFPIFRKIGSVQNWILGTITLLCCILFHIFAKSYYRQLSVLFGLIVGYIVALIMGVVDFSSLSDMRIQAIPHLMPFKMEFRADAIVSVVLIFLVSATETIGDTSALASSGLDRYATEKETSGSIGCDGFVSALSSVFGCLPITSFSQNVGLVAMTKAVLGGCTIMMFGTIVVSGLQMISKCGFSQRNIVIAALSLSVGLGFTQCEDLFKNFPQIVQTVFAQNCVAVVFIVSIILNLVLPKDMEVTRLGE